MEIRRYKSSDQSAVLELHNRGLNQMGTNLGSGNWDNDLNNVEDIYIQNSGEFLVGIVLRTYIL